MRGEYFSWLSHDDLYEPEKIETQVKLIKTDKDIILCSGSLISQNGTHMHHRTKTLDKVLNGRDLFKEFLHHYNLNGLGFLVPKEAFEKAGGFDESLRYLQDLDMWLRLMWYDYRFVCHSDLLVMTRIHKKQVTNTGANIFFSDKRAMAEKHIKLLDKAEVFERDKLMKLYFLLFMKANNKQAIAKMKPQIKKLDGYGLLYSKGCAYRAKERIRDFLRELRDIFYKIKKVRD